nr:hypothetical protein [Bacillus sp. TH12]
MLVFIRSLYRYPQLFSHLIVSQKRNNPAAGRIYKRLGFKDIGMWTMYR